MPSNDYHYSEIKEIMVTKPSWILRWGNVLILAVFMLLLVFAAFVTYPESITTSVTLTAVREVEVVKPAPVNWGIQAVLVAEGAAVAPGTPLVAWYDPQQADYQEVYRLRDMLLQYSQQTRLLNPAVAEQKLLRQFFAIDTLKLGMLRPAYQALNQQLLRGRAISPANVADVLQRITSWQDRYITLARTSGQARLNYSVPQTANQIAATQPILYVQPPSAEFVAHGYVTDAQYATVAKGQKVFVALTELGGSRLEGQVLGVAPLAEGNRHQVFIRLSEGNHELLNPTFSGSAQIVLRKQPLLKKFLTI